MRLVELGTVDALAGEEAHRLVLAAALVQSLWVQTLRNRSRVSKGRFESTFLNLGGHDRSPVHLLRVTGFARFFDFLLLASLVKLAKLLANALDLLKCLVWFG